jgi:adenosylcobinamide-GDP ribazoletransferase
MKSFLAALQFLTVIPVRLAEPPAPARAAVAFPLVGALLGLLAAGLWRLLTPVLPRSLIALLVLAFLALLTGGLHEDGLADTADAFGGGHSREDILRILKDSRIGAFGALALVFAVLLRWQALVVMPAAQVLPALVASQALPRAGLVLLAFLAGPATSGLGGSLAAEVRVTHALSAAALALAIAAAVWGVRAAPAAAACLFVVICARFYFRRRLGGVTGDCLGAACQLQEIAVLLVACL